MRSSPSKGRRGRVESHRPPCAVSSAMRKPRVKPNFHELGLTELRTAMGNVVRAYNAERSICDMLRSKNRVDIECYTAALKLYFPGKEKNLDRLAEYATKLGVMDKLTPYLEVLG